jgi:hypothetical protein
MFIVKKRALYVLMTISGGNAFSHTYLKHQSDMVLALGSANDSSFPRLRSFRYKKKGSDAAVTKCSKCVGCLV